jgi:hypothetical protein
MIRLGAELKNHFLGDKIYKFQLRYSRAHPLAIIF